MEAVKRFVKDERGLETVEYAIILGLVVVATILAIGTLGGWVRGQFNRVNADLAANAPVGVP